MTDQEYTQAKDGLLHDAMSVLESLKSAKLKLKHAKGKAHDRRIFMYYKKYDALLRKVSHLQSEHQRILMQIHKLNAIHKNTEA